MLIHQIKLLYQVHLIRASSYGGGLQMSKVYCDLLCSLQLLCSFSENVCKGPPKHWEKLAGSFSTVSISRPCSVAQILNEIISLCTLPKNWTKSFPVCPGREESGPFSRKKDKEPWNEFRSRTRPKLFKILYRFSASTSKFSVFI